MSRSGINYRKTAKAEGLTLPHGKPDFEKLERTDDAPA